MFNGRRECSVAREMLEDRIQEFGEQRGRETFYEEANVLLRDGSHDWNTFRIRPLFEEFVDDGERILRDWDEQRRSTGRISTRFVEGPGNAMDTSHFSTILGQISFSETLDQLNSPAFIGRDLFTTVPAQTQYEEIIPGVTKIGGNAVEQVGEGEEYPIVRPGPERIYTPEKIKDGFISVWTREIVQEDNVGIIANMQQYAGEAMAINWERELLDTALGLTTSYSRNGGAKQATYGNTHTDGDFDNVAAVALEDWSDIESALLLFDAITDPNTGDPVMIDQPIDLVVPTALSWTADMVDSATQVRTTTTSNPGNNTVTISAPPNRRIGRLTIHTNPFVKERTSDATDWFIGNFRRAFRYIESWQPDLDVMDGNTWHGFSRDIIGGVKISRKGTPAVINPRFVVKSSP